MRENASQYHARVSQEFYDALVKGEDALNEAANVLFSAENMKNHGFTDIPLMKQARDYINVATEMSKPNYREESQTITSRSTKHEPSPRPHHRAIPLFHIDDWLKAKKDGNLRALDEMNRKYTGWRHQTRPNIDDYHPSDITDEHHRVHGMGLFYNYNDRMPNYGTTPAFYKMMRNIFSRNQMDDFNNKMIKASKKMHPAMKNMIGSFTGNGFNIKKMFNIGFEDWKKDYEKKFPNNKKHMQQHYVWCKYWENEGLPRDYILREGFRDSGIPKQDAGKKFTNAIKSGNSIQTDDGRWVNPKLERIGIDAYLNGIYMLPNDMIRDVNRWLIDGAENPKELDKIVGDREVADYMGNHNRVMNAALFHKYAGGSLRKPATQTVANRHLKDSQLKNKLLEAPEAHRKDIIDRVRKGKLYGIKEDLLDSVMGNLDFTDAIADYSNKKGIEVRGGGRYPHIEEDFFEGTTVIEMTNEIPKFKRLRERGFFDSDSGRELMDTFAHEVGSAKMIDGKNDMMMESMSDFHYTSNFDEDWLEAKDAKEEDTLLGMVTDALGGHGSQDGQWDDIGQLREDAMPGVWFDTLRNEEGQPLRMIVPAFREELGRKRGTKAGPKKGQVRKEVKDKYTPSEDEALNAANLERLRRQASRYGYSEEEQAMMADKYASGETVTLRIPAYEDAKGKTKAMLPEECQLALPEDLPRVAASDSLGRYIGAETHYRAEEEDPYGLLSMDGLHNDHATVTGSPMSVIQYLRDQANNSGVEKLLRRDSGSDRHQPFILNHDKQSPLDRLLIHVGMKGAHEPLDVKDDIAIQHWKEGKYGHNRRTDPTGQMRGAQTVNDELMSDIETMPSTNYSIYSEEEYRKYLNAKKAGKHYSPVHMVEPSLTKRELMQELIANDDEYSDEENKRVAIKDLTDKLDSQDKMSNPNNIFHRGTMNGESYVIAPDMHSLAFNDKMDLVEQLRYEKDDAKRDLLYARINELNKEIDYSRVNPSSNNNLKMKMARETHDISKEIFNALVKPVFEKHFGDKLFGHEGMSKKENNAAWHATAYGMYVAEYIASNLTPIQRANLASGLSLHDKAHYLKDYISEDDFSKMSKLQVKRNVLDDKSDKLDLLHMFPEQTTGMELARYLHRGNEDEDSLHTFNKIMDEVESASKEQNISFEDAFMSRYYPHKKLETPVKRRAPSKDNKRTVNTSVELVKDTSDIEELQKKLPFRDGGVYYGIEGFTHGGKSIGLSKQKEWDAIHSVVGNMLNKTKRGSNVAVLGKRIKHRSGLIMDRDTIFPNTSKKDMTSKYERVRDLAHALADETTSYSPNTDEVEKELNFGGRSLKHAPLIPIMTSKEAMREFGRNVPLNFVVNEDALKQGNFIFNTPNNSPNALPNQMNIRLPVYREPIHDVNPNLQAYDFNQDNAMSRGNQFIQQAQNAVDMTDYKLTSSDIVIDDSLIFKEDGKPPPMKFMHRIFDLDDMQHLRGFTGDWVISLYPQGEHVIVTKKGKEMTAYGAEGDVKLDEAILEEKDKVYEKDFTVHAILHDGMMTVIDLLKTGDEDTHNMPAKDRIRHLRAQYESSEHIKMPEPINTKRSDDEGLKTAIDGLRNEQNIDILLRDANATYMKGEPRHPKWVLLSKEKMADVIILSRAGTNYTIGVGPLMHPENYGKRAQKVGDEHYMNVGSAKGPRGLNVGDFATVRCTGVSASKGEHPVYRIRSAKITDNEPLAADSVETLAIIHGEHHVAQRVGMKKGQIIINFPAFEDDVICKTRKEGNLWLVEPQTTTWGNEYLVKLAIDQQPYWEYQAALLLKEKEPKEEPEYDEVNPEPPAGHSKKPKKVLEEEEEIIKRGLELLERGLEHLAKEKITSTGVQGLGIDYATPDESPRGPTQNINDNTMPDFDPAAREDGEEKPATAKKTNRLRTSQGEEARLEENGVIAIEDNSLNIR